jgi:hypothetical protein
MTRAARNILMAATLALPLGGCGSVGSDINFDPVDWISGEWFHTKKPLPGDRKAMFPEGVPGVARGVPPEIVKGNQPPPDAEDATQSAVQVEEPKPKPKANPKPKAAAKAAPPAAPASRPTTVTVRRPEPPPQQESQQQPQQQQPGGAQWPNPPSTQSQAPAAVPWPDPPPLR